MTELTYWAYSAMNNGQQFPFLALNVSNTGGSTTDDILFFEPPYQAPGTGDPSCTHQSPTIMVTWQKWDALTGCWWDNNGELGSGGIFTMPLSAYIALHPNAAIVNANGIGGLRLAVGFASNIDLFDGNIDMVTVGVRGQGSTSYDFEPASACRKGDGDGDFEDDKGHKHHGHFHHDSCEDGRGDVEDDDPDSGKHFESTSISSATFTSDADSQILTMTGTGLDDGIPVGFTIIAVDYDGVTPAVYTLALTNGRTFTGTLVSGSLLIQ